MSQTSSHKSDDIVIKKSERRRLTEKKIPYLKIYFLNNYDDVLEYKKYIQKYF